MWSLLLAAAVPATAAAQAGRGGERAGEERPAAELPGDTVPDPSPEGGGFSILGRRAQGPRLIGGMWTLHPFAISFPRVEETHGVGLLWRGWFGTTFVNSHGNRALAAGVERVWWEPSFRFLSFGVGYRAGLVTGYDDRLLSWADDVPAVPFAGILSWVRVGPARFDAFYVYRVVTLELSLGLR